MPLRVSGCYVNEDLMRENGGWTVFMGATNPTDQVCFSLWSDTPDASGRYRYEFDIFNANGERTGGGSQTRDTPLVRPARTVSFDAFDYGGSRDELLDPWANDTPFTPFLMSNYRNSLAAMELRPGILYAAGSVVAFGGLIALMRR